MHASQWAKDTVRQPQPGRDLVPSARCSTTPERPDALPKKGQNCSSLENMATMPNRPGTCQELWLDQVAQCLVFQSRCGRRTTSLRRWNRLPGYAPLAQPMQAWDVGGDGTHGFEAVCILSPLVASGVLLRGTGSAVRRLRGCLVFFPLGCC